MKLVNTNFKLMWYTNPHLWRMHWENFDDGVDYFASLSTNNKATY